MRTVYDDYLGDIPALSGASVVYDDTRALAGVARPFGALTGAAWTLGANVPISAGGEAPSLGNFGALRQTLDQNSKIGCSSTILGPSRTTAAQ